MPPRQTWQMASARASAASAGLGSVVELEDPGDHGADLVLGGASGAGDRGLDLARGVQADRDAVAGGDQHRNAGGLGRAHHGLHVVLGEDPLDGDGGGPVAR